MPSWKRKLALKVSALFALALVAVAAVIFLAPTDRTWRETKRALEARGEVLDWEKLIPPTVPAEENLFTDPVAASLLPVKGQAVPPNPFGVEAPRLPPDSEALGFPFAMSNLVTLPRISKRDYELSLAGLDDWFAQWDESFVQLRAAGNRAHARLPGDYSAPALSPIPNFVAARTLAQVLSSRAKVHLLLGKPNRAFEDLETLEVVMKSFETQPRTLVTAMIHVAIAGLYVNIVDEGLRHNLWPDAELQKIPPRLLEMNLFHVLKEGMRAERAGTLRHLSAMAERERDPMYQATVDAFTSGEWTVERAVIQFAPASWIRDSQAQFARILQGYLDAINPQQRRVDQTLIDAYNAEVTEITSRWSPRKAILLYVTPNFSKAAATMARTQTHVHQLALACALQRYRSKNGCYPERLEQLVPEYISTIPNDVYSAVAVRYEHRPGGYEIFASTNKLTHPTHAGNFIWQGE